MAVRTAAQKEMERDFLKLRNKALYGKACGNQRHRSDIRLGTHRTKIAKLISKPHCLKVGAFDRTMIGDEFLKVKHFISRPSYGGFAFLERGKLHMLHCVPLPLFCCFSLSVSFKTFPPWASIIL